VRSASPIKRIVDGVPLRLLDVLDPGLVIAHGIDAEPDDLGVPLVEFGLETGHVAELGGANGREVLRMREEDRHLSPIHSWKRIFPSVVSAVKSGASSPMRTDMFASYSVRGPATVVRLGMRDCSAARECTAKSP